jgi:hypothetical protein
MEKLPVNEILSTCSGILTTGLVFSKMFFSRISKLETAFSDSILKLNTSLNEIDKRLAINSCIIDQLMKGGCIHGRKKD